MYGKEIKDYLSKNGIRQTYLSKKININNSTLSAMLHGHRRISIEEYIDICKALNLEITYFADKISGTRH